LKSPKSTIKKERQKMNKPDIEKILPLIQMSVEEDLGSGDVTSELFFGEKQKATTRIVPREDMIVCGMDIVKQVLSFYSKELKLSVLIDDSLSAKAGQVIGTIDGPLRAMLSAERVVLNFLQRLSGIATITNKYAEAVENTNAKILDTRKTTPGWRQLEKYAVRCGGGFNHRMGLYDAVLIKDNHLAQLGENFKGQLEKIIAKARKLKNLDFVEVEVDDVEGQLDKILQIAGIDIILLDNMSPDQLTLAVKKRNAMFGQNKAPLLEASGGIKLENVAQIAATGVQRISVGAITHSAIAVDIGLDRE
jgi:nicotinate-nucleotide pyrophosphorylase (carboxylating)